MSDPQTKLGQLIEKGAQRDAIHIAVAPVVASHILHPGDHVGFVASNQEIVGHDAEPIGIVDPFLKAPVMSGERFWLFLYPNTITALKHVWMHPAFIETEKADESSDPATFSRRWIENFAASIPLSYETLMMGADDWVRDQEKNGWGEYLCFGGLLEGESVPADFWPHYEIVRARSVDEKHRGSFFTCSC